MAKTVIDAKEVLKDIRSGLNDSELMEKYNLTPRVLERLFVELAQLGAIKRISAAKLLRDIRQGITNKDLMEKYNLTRWGLKKAFTQMTEAGIAFFDDRAQERVKLRIRTSEVLRDIRSGMTELEIMAKYGLSSRGLQSTFWKLVRSGALTWDDLLSIYPNMEDSVTLQRTRNSVRSYPILGIRVYEEGNSENRGKIKDLSEKGFGVIGIVAAVGERKTLVLVPDELFEIEPLSVVAECRWFKSNGQGGLSSAGFEMLDVDTKISASIQELVQLMTLTFET